MLGYCPSEPFRALPVLRTPTIDDAIRANTSPRLSPPQSASSSVITEIDCRKSAGSGVDVLDSAGELHFYASVVTAVVGNAPSDHQTVTLDCG